VVDAAFAVWVAGIAGLIWLLFRLRKTLSMAEADSQLDG
jgi:hypothetical protein